MIFRGIILRHLNSLKTTFHSPCHQKLNYSTTLDGEILTQNIKGKKIITLNRTKALNALTLPMVERIYAELKEKPGQKPYDMVIVRGAGPKAFCAGGDVVAVSKSFKEGSSIFKEFFRSEYRLNYLIGTLNAPYVAIMDGITMGGGCGISINGLFRVATEKTVLAMPETALGLFPDVGGTYFLSRLPNKLGMFLALTGYRLNGADVYHAGLATHYIESSNVIRLNDALLDLTRAECTPKMIDDTIKMFKPAHIATFSLAEHLDLIQRCFEANTFEEVFKNLKENKSEFAKARLAELKKMSPTSLKVTFQQQKRGSKLKFDQVFPLEYRLVQRFIHGHDFHEGIRAILVEKDKNPKWSPPTVQEVPDKLVDAYFAPFENPDDELTIN